MATWSDVQLEAIAGLAQARLNREVPVGEQAGSYCRVAELGPLSVAPPRTAHPFVEVFANGETFKPRGARMHVQRVVEVTLRYFLGPCGKTELRTAFRRLRTSCGWLLEAIQRGGDEDWHDSPTPPTPITYYTLPEHGLIASILPVRCAYAYAEAGEGEATVHPALVMTIEMTHDLRAYSTNTEPLTRVSLNLNLDGAAEGASGYHIGKLTAVTGTEGP